MHNNHETVIIPQTIIVPTKCIIVASQTCMLLDNVLGRDTGDVCARQLCSHLLSRSDAALKCSSSAFHEDHLDQRLSRSLPVNTRHYLTPYQQQRLFSR